MGLDIFVVALRHGRCGRVDELRVRQHDRVALDAHKVAVGNAGVAVVERKKLRQKLDGQEDNVPAHDGRAAVLPPVLVVHLAAGEVEGERTGLTVDNDGLLVAAAGIENAEVRAGDGRACKVQPPAGPEGHRVVTKAQKLIVDGGEVDRRIGAGRSRRERKEQ